MKLATLPTKLVIVLSILTSFAFLGDEDSFSFDLSTSRIYAPGDPETALEFSSNGLAANQVVRFRAFRVDDPVAFFLAQKDPHSPTLLASVKANTFDMLDVGVEKIRRDARYAARDVMPAEARRAIRDVADVNGVKAEQREKQNNPVKPTVGTTTEAVPKGAERYEIVGQWEHRLEAKSDNPEQNWRYESIKVPIRDKGTYLIEARVRGKRAIAALVISEYGMIIKQVDDEALAFVTNRRTGQKVADVPLHFARSGKEIGADETGNDGLVKVSLPAPAVRQSTEEDWESMWDYRDRQVLVVGEKDGNLVISDPYYYGDYGYGNFKIYLHTDRPVYRPAQPVYYRGIVRTIKSDGTYGSAAGDTAFVEINDARDGNVRRDTLVLNQMGTFNGEVLLGDEPPLGTYTIKASVKGEEHWFNFSVEEYKKPEYKVVVTADKEQYTRGDMINAKVEANYFFGSPVANAQVEYFVYRARYYRPWWRGSEWEYLYEEGDDFYTYRMEMVHSAEGVLGPDGTLEINYQTDPQADQDYVYRVQANVVDNSRRSIAGAKSVEVTRGEFYISARTDKYVYRPGERAKLIVETATFDGDRPVATAFTTRVLRTWWEETKRRDTSARGPGSDTVMISEYTKKSEQIWSGSGSTGADGRGEVIYTPERAGYFEVVIDALDRRGTKITESSYMYVADDSYANWYRDGSGDVQIIPDKVSYEPGEVMSALVIMPAAGIDALVTMEGATIYSSQVERLTATSAVVHVKIEERHAPVAYLSASAMVNDELYSESKRITVVPQGKLIKLEIVSDKEVYRPGAKGTVIVRATDERGAPVPDADVALAMVDEAVYSIQPDATPDIQRSFYGNRWNDVITSSSLNFSFYGVSRKITEGDDLYSEVDGQRGTSRFASTGGRDRRNIAYGDVKGEMFVQPAMRKNFKDMMFWTPSVRTDGNGTAKLDVDFPDNLTTWRITARAVTASSAVGQAVARVVARKDLMVRMEMPRFLIQGDELLVATTVHNYLANGKRTKVEISGTNATLVETEKTVDIGANGVQRIDWKVTAPTTGNVTLQVKALTDEESDAMELTIPVLPRGLRMATSQSGMIAEPTGNRTLAYTLPENSDPSTRSLKVTLSPSAAGSMLGALDELIGYPYGCVEQTMSRFLPTVVVAQLLKDLNVPFDAARREAIPKMVAKGFSKLYGMQHQDGGWGWWENDGTDPYMTAYVIYGMTVARRADYAVDETRYNSGVERLRAYIDTKNDSLRLHPTTEAYILYVASLVNAGKTDKVLAEKTASLARRDTLNSYGRALLTLAAVEQRNSALATSQVSRLEARATPVSNGVFWNEAPGYYWNEDEVEATAFAVRAIFAVKGETDLVTKGVQWLLSRKEGEAWHNTRQTATVIYSLTDYLKKTRELEPDYTVTVKVNGTEAWSGRITRADVFAPEKEIVIDASRLKAGANNVTIEKSGTGRVYTSGLLTYFATGNAVRQSASGIKVSREYFLLKKEREGDVYVYRKRPFTGMVKTGEEIFVKVKVQPDARQEYFMLEDPLPAGCEVVEATEGYTIPGEAEYDEKAREAAGYYGWRWWFASREVRDEKVSFFATRIDPRETTFSYIMRAQIPGNYGVMPAVGSLMYYPEVRGNSAQLAMRITP